MRSHGTGQHNSAMGKIRGGPEGQHPSLYHSHLSTVLSILSLQSPAPIASGRSQLCSPSLTKGQNSQARRDLEQLRQDGSSKQELRESSNHTAQTQPHHLKTRAVSQAHCGWDGGGDVEGGQTICPVDFQFNVRVGFLESMRLL